MARDTTKVARETPSHSPESTGKIVQLECVNMRVRHVSRIVSKIYDDAFRSLGITSAQFTLMNQIAVDDGISAYEIGERLAIEKSTISRNLRRLIILGFVSADPPPQRRGRRLHVTERGTTVLTHAYAKWIIANTKVIRVIGEKNVTSLNAILHAAEKLENDR